MKFLLFTIILLGVMLQAKSQAVYEIECNLPGKQKGKALVVIETENEYEVIGYLRMAWYDKVRKENVITDLEIQYPYSKVFNAYSDSVLVRETKHLLFCRAYPVKNAKGKAPFPANDFTFWMEKPIQGNHTFTPYTGKIPDFGRDDFYVKFYSTEKGPPNIIGFKDSSSINQYKKIQPSELTSTLLKKYFSTDELVYPYPLSIPQLSIIRNKTSATLYCITVTDILDEKISLTTLKDKESIQDFFKAAARTINLNYKTIELEGDNYSLAKLSATIHALQVKSNDVVVFAFSGHGFSYTNDPTFQYPQLALWHGVKNEAYFRANSINLETVFNKIRAKGARLNIVIGDCCNTDAGITRKISELPPIAMMEYEKPPHISRNYMRLFIEAKGSYIACAAKKGEPAAGDFYVGGFFTNAIVKSLDNRIKQEADINPQTIWTEMFAKAGNMANNYASRLICREFKGPCRQTMVFKKIMPATPKPKTRIR